MRNNFKFLRNILFATFSISLFLCSCQWETVTPTEIVVPDSVSFSKDIQPIFTAKCVTCHTSSHVLPLVAGSSYTNLISGSYVNISFPNQSIIYTKPAMGGTHYAKYSATEAGLVLKWIQDGALNN